MTADIEEANGAAAVAPPAQVQAEEGKGMGEKTEKKKKKLHGRAFYESIGSPKYVVAPMVDQSEFAWRMLTRSFIPESEQSDLLAYTPMLHARLFHQDEKYRRAHFQATRPSDDGADNHGETNNSEVAETGESKEKQPWLDGNPALDRPLFVQFCANDPEHLLAAARHAAPHCDAVDLNLGCPQGIARKGRYGAFLQEEQGLIHRLISTLHRDLDVPVTAKIRILDDEASTLAYARNVLDAGASIITVHGRRREQKGHLTGLADWHMLRFLRDNLPPDTVIFANGNVLQGEDVERCLAATGADGVMSAEGNLSDPAIFGRPPPPGEEGREYWRGRDGGLGGWRVDAVTRRYMDILHRYALEQDPPARKPLFVPSDEAADVEPATAETQEEEDNDDDGPPAKKQKMTTETATTAGKKNSNNNNSGNGNNSNNKRPDANPNLSAVQPHLFHLLRHFVSRHTDVRDMLARAKRFPRLDGYEEVLAAVEQRVAEGLREYDRTGGASWDDEVRDVMGREEGPEGESSVATIKRCKRPWWVVQPIVRPLPQEAMKKGAIRMSKKEIKAKEKKEAEEQAEEKEKRQDIKERDQLVSG
ncbi:hypothetical protein N3K66_001546 [Trichothecium roseum]|uniref:Uncharacterized protein n=1 Tax=Trichothecium roseum TaxID=47278 RepID=A0ACC0VGJ7_9HYPO|nr:hypothetical protein N3K66_001546 [Trichothecium roseum]